MMEKILQLTADGSHTLFIPSMDEHYHSVNGAIQEAMHVFIEAGLHSIQKEFVRILEIGFGTGLNAFLTLRDVEENSRLKVEYHSIELYPLNMEVISSLNYGKIIWPDRKDLFEKLHFAKWNTPEKISDNFTLCKIEGDSNVCDLPVDIDLIYFDAFAPDKQPEMWTQAIFDRLYSYTAPGGIIVTYCAKGEVRRMMQKAGYAMSRLPGPPGKRHMLYGKKI